jgi:hypothetical protein
MHQLVAMATDLLSKPQEHSKPDHHMLRNSTSHNNLFGVHVLLWPLSSCAWAALCGSELPLGCH